MHEISLVRNIFKTLEHELVPDEFQLLSDIHLSVGLLANVEPSLLQNAFEAVVSTEYPTIQAKLHIELLPILVHCASCNTDYEVQSFNFKCTNCGTANSQVLQGNELLIKKIELTNAHHIVQNLN